MTGRLLGIILLFNLNPFSGHGSKASVVSNSMFEDRTKNCVALLQEAMVSAESFFVRVHAAEALIANNYPAGIKLLFLQLQKAAPENFIGASRVLAKLHEQNPQKQHYLKGILDVFLHEENYLQRLIALESLGKLNYYSPMPELKQQAETGEKRLKSMARWVMANSGSVQDEHNLAKLFTSEEPFDYRDAAYAFRFRQTMRHESYALLQACARRLDQNNPHRVYVISAQYVHAPTIQTEQAAFENLAFYVSGQNNERYEVAEALGTRGRKSSVAVLEKLMQDSDLDVRVAAANAILKIERRRNEQK